MTTELLYPNTLGNDDIAAIITLYNQLSPRKAPASPENIRMAVAANCVFVIREEGTRHIIAMATLVTIRKLEGGYGYVHDVVVRDDQRGKGLSHVLMNDLVVEARAQRLLYLELTSGNQREAAIGLYTSLGFTRHETNLFRLPLTQN